MDRPPTTPALDMQSSSFHRCPQRRESGFSLTEGLLVVGVIAVLAALLAPAISMARNSSRNIRCIANMRSAGAALHTFISDRNGEFRSFARGGNTGEIIWGIALKNGSYIADPAVLRCPAGQSLYELTSPSWAWNTYAFNMAAANGSYTAPAGNAQNYRLKLAAIPDLANRPMLVDSATLTETIPGVRSETFRVNIARVSDGVQLRHKGRANVLFMDGHFKALSREEAEEYFNPDYIYEANRTF